MIKIRSLLKEDEFDLTDNPLKNTNLLQPNQCLEIIMEMSRGFSDYQVFLVDKPADIFIKEDLEKEISDKLEEMYEDVKYYFDQGDEFLPWLYKDIDAEVPQAQKLADKVYLLSTGDESDKFVIGNNKEVIGELSNYLVFDNGKYEITDNDGLDEYLDSLVENDGEWLDTVEDGYFLKRAIKYRKKLEKGIKQ